MTTPSPEQTTSSRREVIDQARCVVVKVGTRVLTTPDGMLDRNRVDKLAAGLCHIADSGRQIIMVSSGAVGAGVGKLGLATRPTGLAQLQAVAAIGQTDLIQAYEAAFSTRNRHAAQILLTAADLKRRSGYLHVRNALTQIHAFGSIAVVNENDSVAVAELMTTFGDNDHLAAHVAGLLNDALLIILSDIDGLYDKSPEDPSSRLIETVADIDDSVLDFAQDHSSNVSKGGMASKLKAAALAISHGHPTIIGPGRTDNVLQKIFAAEPVGTLFLPSEKSIRGRRRWIGSTAPSDGTLTIDAGASRAVQHDGSSLLAIGITSVAGTFKRGAVVSVIDSDGNEIAKGLSNYPAIELRLILGLSSDKISAAIGHRPYETVIHRDNMTLADGI